MRGLIALALLAGLPIVTGCASVTMRPDSGYRAVSKLRTAVLPPPGLVYTKHKAPLVFVPRQQGLRSGVLGARAASQEREFEPITFGSKMGTATSSQLGLPPLPFPGLTMGLDLFGWGDASQDAAAKSAGIRQITHADYQFEVYLAIFRRVTVEVYGD